MRSLKNLICVVSVCTVVSYEAAYADDAVVEVLQEYLDFANYNAGIITPQQLTKDAFELVSFVDTRSENDFEAATIPGAIHIEWREILERVEEIPSTGKVILFCDTGVLSAQAVFALRATGHDHVLVLQSGFEGWRNDAPYKP